MQRDGTLKDVILHEMAHVIGIGTLWDLKSLLTGVGSNNPEYVGPKAMQEYATLRGETQLKPIPVANTGGPGTAEGHWRESTFDYELMTGYVEEDAEMPLSRMTVAALDDLGYKVDYSAADEYALPMRPAVTGAAAAPVKRRVHHYCKAKFPEIQVETNKVCGCC